MSPLIDSLEPRRLLSFGISAGVELNAQNTQNIITSFNAQQTLVAKFKVSKTGTLFITGTGRKDVINVNVNNGRLIGDGRFFSLVDPANPALANAVHVTGGEFSETFVYQFHIFANLPKIKRISIEGMGGDDKITVNADIPVTVRGARGDDTIMVNAPTRTIEGGSGTNTVLESDTPVFVMEGYYPTVYTPLTAKSFTASFFSPDPA